MKTQLLGVILLSATGHNLVLGQDTCQKLTTLWQTHRNIGKALTAYRSELAGRGLTAEQIGKEMAEVANVMATCPPLAALNFDIVYTSDKKPFRTAPNAFLMESMKDVQAGRALDVAMGEGRNAVYLASNGWDVTGFDISPAGLAAARAAAERAGVKIQTVLQSWQDFDFGSEKWDLIVLSYAWVPISDPALAKRLVNALRAGGLLMFEHYLTESVSNARSELGMPKPNELLKVFGGQLRILRYEDAEIASDWEYQRKQRVARLLAKK